MSRILTTAALASTILMIGIASQAQAQLRRSIPPNPFRLMSPPVTPENPQRLAAPGSGGNAAIDDGDTCSGVAACNDFIADCIGSGGEYVPIDHDDKGRPSAGSCSKS
ncbi:MAG: hypothetical protein GVY17_09780 [Cyanobacteria bacterium]|jgi:hypothetical protein|nr:hypothetical protein [Cyanobacteria bacterium GSL.Bin21]